MQPQAARRLRFNSVCIPTAGQIKEKPFRLLILQQTLAADAEPVTAKVIAGKDAKQAVVCQTGNDLLTVAFAVNKACSTVAGKLPAQGREGQLSKSETE